MTDRLYRTDSYTTQFTAHVTDVMERDGRYAAVFDATYFYPTSGGQRHDTGTVGDARVVDVVVQDGVVLHQLDRAIAAGKHTATIDWARRFDHMQQHTGQHILSRSFINEIDATTVGFHMSDTYTTIDLDQKKVSEAVLARVETAANQIVWEDRPIRTYTVGRAEAERMKLRKLPDVAGDIRIVEIDAFDQNACGGTHLKATAAVGLIKLIDRQSIRNLTRLTFVCGNRALRDYQQRYDTAAQTAALLTCAVPDLPDRVSKLQTERKQLQKASKQQRTQLLQYQAAHLLAQAEQIGDMQVINHFIETDGGTLRQLASRLTRQAGVIALLGSADTIVLARAADAPGDMQDHIATIIDTMGGRGGGSATMVQIGSVQASPTEIKSLLSRLVSNLTTSD